MAAALADCAALVARLSRQVETVAQIAERLVATFRAGRSVLTCGNGGSAAEALHLAEELVGRYQPRPDRRGLPAICLSADPTAITCIANDFGFEQVFARQVEAHGRRGDALVALSTSGRSPSILRALERARQGGLTTIGLLGPAGSPAEALCDLKLCLDETPAARVQEAHLIAIHLCLEEIDRVYAAE